MQNVLPRWRWTAGAAAIASVLLVAQPDAEVLLVQHPPHAARPAKPVKVDVPKVVDDGLAWLARHQDEDGSWRGRHVVDRCGPKHCWAPEGDHDDFDTGLTGLAVLAFLRAGHVPGTSKEIVDPLTNTPFKPAEVVTRGLEWLRKHQSTSGEFAAGSRSFVYDEALAELAMSEACGLTKDPHWQASAQHGADALVRAQRTNPAGKGAWGWHYAPLESVPPEQASASDTSATGWCVVALSTAQSAGIQVEKTAFQGALDFADFVCCKDGLVGYVNADTAGQAVMGPHDEFKYHAGTMSALGILIRLDSGTAATNSFFDLAAREILKDMPAAGADTLSIDYYSWFQGSSALNRLDEMQPKKARTAKTPKKYAEAWNHALAETVAALQDHTADRCSQGGWVVSDRWSHSGGPVYSTAMALLALEAGQPAK